MTIKHIEDNSWSVEEANKQINQDFDPYYWQFLIRLINIDEVTWNNKSHTIEFSDYIPLRSLLQELLVRIPTDEFLVKQCHICQHYFNVNNDDGIFGDSDNLSHFICKSCAHSLNAWDFYQDHLNT
jgi:hypothetical protein